MSLKSSLIVATDSRRSSLTQKKVPAARPRPREKIRPPSYLQKIFLTRNQPNSQYYLSQALSVTPDTAKDVGAERSPFAYPDELEQFSYRVIQKTWHEKRQREENKAKYCCKNSAATRLSKDLLQRLYVEKEDTTHIKTLIDIDPEFFAVAEGRPIDRRFSMSKYLQDLRNILRIKLMIGYRHDEVLILEEKMREEQKIIDQISRKFKLYSQCFEAFLKKDYDESIKMLREAENLAVRTIEKSDLIKSLYNDLASIEFTVHKLEERWRDLKMYQKFLYFVSPLSWRKKYDYIHRQELNMEIEREPSTVFKKYQLTSEGRIPSLEILVDQYIDQISNEEEPKLYFQSPNELKKVFRFMEIQNLNCLLHTEDMAIPMENMILTMKNAKEKFEAESAAINETIETLTKGIRWEENCAEELRNTAMKLIDGPFRQAISDEEVLKLYVFVEDVYETCIQPNDAGLSMFEMMRAIEHLYHDLILKLDALPQDIVKKSEKYRFAEETKLNEICKVAAQRITLVERITSRLKKSLLPPVYRKSKPLVWRSAPYERTYKTQKFVRGLTKKEQDYLFYFTDFCTHTSELKDYGIDLSVPESDLNNLSVTQALEKNLENKD